MTHPLTRANWLWQIACLFFLVSNGLFVFYNHLPWWYLAIHVILVGGNAFLIQWITRQYELLGSLSIFPAVAYLIIHACCPAFIAEPQAYIASAMLSFACINIFNCYQLNECRVNIFNTFFLICLAAIFLPGLILLIPVFWIVVNLINTLNFRRWAASILAILLFALVLFTYIFCFGKEVEAQLFWTNCIENFHAPIYLASHEYLFFALIIILSTIAVFHFLYQGQRSKRNSTRYFNIFLIVLGLCLGGMMLLFSPHRYEYLALAAMPFSILLGLYFNDKHKIVSHILFLLVLAGGIYCYFCFL